MPLSLPDAAGKVRCEEIHVTNAQNLQTEIQQSLALMREKLGIRGTTASETLSRCKRMMPRHVYGAVKSLADAESYLEHPRLRQTLDTTSLSRAASDVTTHLKAVDTADRRKGWWLGMLGGLAFNMIAFGTLLVVVLIWRGFI